MNNKISNNNFIKILETKLKSYKNQLQTCIESKERYSSIKPSQKEKHNGFLNNTYQLTKGQKRFQNVLNRLEKKYKHTKISCKKTKATKISPKRVKPTHVSPRRIQHTKISPKRVKPTHVSPRRIQPTKISPKRVKPTCVSPRRIQPTKISPKRVKPTHVSPRRIQPTKISPKRVKPTRVLPKQKASRLSKGPLRRYIPYNMPVGYKRPRNILAQ